MTALLRLISEAEQWRRQHKAALRHIDAAACSIRIRALKDALDAVKGEK